MRGRMKAAWLTGAALVCMLAVVGTAVAATQVRLSVDVTPKRGTYGTEVVVRPSIDNTVSVGDRIDLFVLDASDAWVKYGEGQVVESHETTGAAPEIEPLYLGIDESLTYPAVMRAVYIPVASSPNASATSEIFSLRMSRNTRTAVSISTPSAIRKNKSFSTTFMVAPISGVGKVAVKVKSASGSYSKSMTLTTDDLGNAATTLKLPRAGRYTISAKFLGNTFGVASPMKSRTITVR
ncbi:MAG: hypothetical protein U1E26_11950 [Coriobacteriia bacterium]|nr:hypothetical protein [Coriobacteriia bacterium]